MCFNCGCHLPDDDMGSSDNITNNTFHQLAEHWGKSDSYAKLVVFEFLNNPSTKLSDHDMEHIEEMFEKAAKVWEQSVDEAKKNTLSMLKRELKK